MSVPALGLMQVAGYISILGCLASLTELASCERIFPGPGCGFSMAFVLDV